MVVFGVRGSEPLDVERVDDGGDGVGRLLLQEPLPKGNSKTWPCVVLSWALDIGLETWRHSYLVHNLVNSHSESQFVIRVCWINEFDGIGSFDSHLNSSNS
eukprot:TRINITY_DN5179_c1_g3_i1.p1 TRINITY_DN5179_c1_g3~~TRINITY_DN5179_c1_g3_i1.p1  ORF type:complete len:101 (-),score=11.06 TRINITY_DN5179_c1_g3_i1:478-780(-)